MTHNEVSALIEERRKKARLDRLGRIEDLERLRPDYRELKLKRNSLYARATIKEIEDKPEEAEVLKEQARQLDLAEKAILKEEGLPENFLDEWYFCSICQDTGYKKDGSVCECLKESIGNTIFSGYDLSERSKEDTFENFDKEIFSNAPFSYNNQLVIPRQQALVNKRIGELFCQNFKTDPYSLYISGPVGTGKTYLISCIVNRLRLTGIDMIYLTANSLINLIHNDLSERKRAGEQNRDKFKTVELLIIDDMGTEPNTDFNSSMISDIIDNRYYTDLKTIISSNFTLADLLERKRYPVRMVSRLKGKYKEIQFTGKDLRNPDD